MESFEAGDSVVLTLKDQGILEQDEHGRATGLAEDEDELENVNMKEAEVRCVRACVRTSGGIVYIASLHFFFQCYPASWPLS